MSYLQVFQRGARGFLRNAAVLITIFLTTFPCRAQTRPAPPAETPWAETLNKYPGLLNEFGVMIGKLQQDVQFPAPRAESRLLPLLPPSTVFYGAFSNYGDAANQTLKVLRQELQHSPVFRDWWTQGDMATAGPKIEDTLQKLAELDQYLGPEVVVSGTLEGQDPRFLLVAEVRKPGLKKFLQQMAEQLGGKQGSPVPVLDLQELATAKEGAQPKQPIVLVRPDFAVAASDLATLRNFNARLDLGSREFVSTSFGQRVLQEYQGGLTVLAAADMQRILSQAPPATKQNVAFQRSGFEDMKYLVWEHKIVAGKPISQMEMTFTGPRNGPASWLAKSSPLGSLDFASPDAMMAGTLVLTNPAQIFDDVKELASLSNPNAFAALPVFEQALNLSLKDDLLGLLKGELTVELDSANPPKPEWRAMLGVKDASHLQRTLNTLVAAAHFESQHSDEGGLTYYTLRIPNPKGTVEFSYALVDGYLILGSSRDTVAQAVRLHRTGQSLAKSKKLLAALPPGRTLNASALLYQDPIAMTALRLKPVAPELAESLAQFPRETSPAVVGMYGEDSAIQEVSTSPSFDAGAVMVVAAIAIPSLVRSKIAANETAAIGSMRAVNTAQTIYSTNYSQRGYAPNLASLGPASDGTRAKSPVHADLLDETLANQSCTADAWCTKSGYRFRVTAVCKQRQCGEYVALAAPVDSNTGTRTFCSTSDGVIRFKAGPPFADPMSVSQCKAWPPIQ